MRQGPWNRQGGGRGFESRRPLQRSCSSGAMRAAAGSGPLEPHPAVIAPARSLSESGTKSSQEPTGARPRVPQEPLELPSRAEVHHRLGELDVRSRSGSPDSSRRKSSQSSSPSGQVERSKGGIARDFTNLPFACFTQ